MSRAWLHDYARKPLLNLGLRVLRVNACVLTTARVHVYEEAYFFLAEDSALEGMVLWAAHRSTLGLNLEQALLCVASLQIDIKKVRDKLQKISKLCPACNQRRALCGRKDQLIKISERAPTDLIFKPLLFPQAKSTHIIDLF